MMEAAAEELEVNAADLETDGQGNIHVKGAPHRVDQHAEDVAIAAQFKQGRTISGRGIFLVPLSDVDPETGEMTPGRPATPMPASSPRSRSTTRPARSTMVAMNSAYELGRALNPKLVEQQLVGGAWMGVSHALYETTEPYYPDREPRPARLQRVPDARARATSARTTSRCSSARRRTARSAARARARCAPTRSCRRSRTPSSTRSACASTTCRSRRRRSCARSRPRAARGRRRRR